MVWWGNTGAVIASQARNCSIPGKVYLCDTFTGVVKASEQHDTQYKGGEYAETSRQIVEDLLFNKMNLDNVEILEGAFPDQTGHLIENQSFRLCHIDVDVYQSAKDIVDWIWQRMVRGRIIIFDDHGFRGLDGIVEFVEEQMPYSDRLVFYNLSGHAVIVKL